MYYYVVFSVLYYTLLLPTISSLSFRCVCLLYQLIVFVIPYPMLSTKSSPCPKTALCCYLLVVNLCNCGGVTIGFIVFIIGCVDTVFRLFNSNTEIESFRKHSWFKGSDLCWTPHFWIASNSFAPHSSSRIRAACLQLELRQFWK